MFEKIKADLHRFYVIESCGDNPGLIKRLCLIHDCPGLQALLLYRFGNWIESRLRSPALFPVRILLRAVYGPLNYIISKMTGIYIDRHADIGKGLYIGHFGGIVVRARQQMGECCSIHQLVSIGSKDDVSLKVKIGDRVWIGAHSRIEGDVKVGDGVTISAGSIVVNDVKDSALVIGNPARIVVREYDNTRLLALQTRF